MPEASAKRISPSTPASELFTFASMILTLPDRTSEVDALIVVRGLGQEWTLQYAVHDHNKYGNRHLLIASANSRERTYTNIGVKELIKAPYNLILPGRVLLNEHMEHTRDKAEWITKQVQKAGIESAALYAPAYHMARAYGTVLKCLLENGLSIPLLPRPVPIPPRRLIPENGQTGWEMAHAEAERIPKYQRGGHVVTLQELQTHINWMWQQPLMRFHY